MTRNRGRGLLASLALQWVIVAIAFAVTAGLLDGVDISGGATSVLWIAVVFGLVNTLIGPIAKLLALPFIVLTLGLFTLVVNAALLGLTAWLTDDLSIDGFWTALVASILISLVTWILNLLLGTYRDD